MTVYESQNNLDRNLVRESLNPLLKIIFGINHSKENNDFIELFEQKVKRIIISPAKNTNKVIGNYIKNKDETYSVVISGYSEMNKTTAKKNAIKIFIEIFTDIIPKLNKDENIPNSNEIKTNETDLIKVYDKNLLSNKTYGTFFHDMAVEIISSIAINQSPFFDHTIEEILTENPHKWENDNTINPDFIKIIQLTIAAFSNNPNINYDELSDMNLGIFDTNTTMHDNTILKDNDFLYGIIWNPLHIEKEFDKYMGEGFYKIFCDYIDTIYYNELIEDKKITKKEKKLISDILASFMNLRINDYISNGMISIDEAKKIRNNFKKIKENSLKQKEECQQKIKK